MAFDQLGILIQRQWDVLKEFLLSAKKDGNRRIEHLRAESNRLGRRIKKLQFAEDALGGTSLNGNPGAGDGNSGATGAGGDLVWKEDIPAAEELDPQDFAIPQDASMSVVVEPLKREMIDVIRRRREIPEYRLKKIFDVREQLDLQAKQLLILTGDGGLVDRSIKVIDSKFDQLEIVLKEQQGDGDSDRVVGTDIGRVKSPELKFDENADKGIKSMEEILRGKILKISRSIFADTERSTRGWPRIFPEKLSEILRREIDFVGGTEEGDIGPTTLKGVDGSFQDIGRQS